MFSESLVEVKKSVVVYMTVQIWEFESPLIIFTNN